MIDREQMAERLDELMTAEVARFLETVPDAAHLTDRTRPLEEAYYLRHRIETIKRIRMTARTDALALALMVEEDYEAARAWARYACEELDHDRLFMQDLLRHGLSEAEVHAVEPFPSTRAMLAYLDRRLGEVGSLAAVAYSIFVEWNSERYSGAVVEKAAEQFSPDHVEGSGSHYGIDQAEDHYRDMIDIAHRLVSRLGDETVLHDLIRDISGLFRDYFRELSEATLGARRAA
jgi:hypothetical protein